MIACVRACVRACVIACVCSHLGHPLIPKLELTPPLSRPPGVDKEEDIDAALHAGGWVAVEVGVHLE